MHSHRGRNLIGSVGGLEGVLRRQFLKAAIATGAVGAAMGPRMVLSTPNRKMGPFSDWSEPVNLGPMVNSGFNDFHPAISRDELSTSPLIGPEGSTAGTPMEYRRSGSVSGKIGTPYGGRQLTWGPLSTFLVTTLASPI